MGKSPVLKSKSGQKKVLLRNILGQKWVFLGYFGAKIGVFKGLWPKAHFFSLFNAKKKFYKYIEIRNKTGFLGRVTFLEKKGDYFFMDDLLRFSTYELADDLRRMRIEAGYSQREVAEELGLTRSTITKYEQDINTPNLRTLKALLNLYGYHIYFGKDD